MKELDLYTAILKNYETQYHVAKELSSGFGIADLVFFKLKKDRVRPISNYPNNTFKHNLLKILLQLNAHKNESICITSFERLLPKRKSDRTRLITYLVRENYIDLLENGDVKAKRVYEVGFEEVIAVEAKISDWKRGLYQAYRYKSFSNVSYLALCSQYIHRAIENIESFKIQNVGLIEVTNFGIKIHFKPKSSPLENNIYSAWAYENVLNSKCFLPSV